MKNAHMNLAAILLIGLLCPSSLVEARLVRPMRTGERFHFEVPQASEPIGLRTVIQVWDPQKPDDHHKDQTLLEPTIVSDSLQAGWTIAREHICTELKTAMGSLKYLDGLRLKDIDCVLDESVAFKLTNGGQNVMNATFAVSGYAAATSTLPDPLPGSLDPRVSIRLTANMKLTIAVQANTDQTLRVSDAVFSLSNTTVDSHSPSADVAKFVTDEVIPFFGAPNYRHELENEVNKQKVELTKYFDAALSPVNAKLKAPLGAIRVGFSFSSNLINVAFGPREKTPPTNGSITGQVRWDPSNFTPSKSCQSFDIRAVVQVGPIPMFVVDPIPPTRQVGTFQTTAVNSNTCSFTLSGLAGGWPHQLTTQIIGAPKNSAGTQIHYYTYALVGEGWSGSTVVPQPIASNVNYVVSYSFGGTAVKNPDISSKAAQVGASTNKVINPADSSPAANGGLNTQPLPPKDSTTATKNEPSVGTQSGIIIVGGQPSTQSLPGQRPRPEQKHRPDQRPRPQQGLGQRPRPDQTGNGTSRVTGDGFDDLATKGATLVDQDSAAAELRNQFPEGPAQRGFNIGMAVAEGHTMPGPGKDSIRDQLPAAERDGFTGAVSYSLTKNRKPLTDLATKGANIAAEVPLMAELRNQLDDSARLGFDIGLAVAEHDTQPGPGKQKIRDSLYPDERSGFSLAVDFSMERNRNIELAQIGAAIAQRDPYVASTRNATTDVFYKLGFDIATGLFGSPSMGSKGNTAIGPGSMRIRDALSPRAQSGFNASVKFHLSRRY